MHVLTSRRRSTHIPIVVLVVLSMLSFTPGAVTAAGTTELISVTTGGTTGNSQSAAPAVNGDGTIVAFWSIASDLVAGDTNDAADIFVRDRTTGTTERVSVSSGGAQGDGAAGELAISADGRFVAFESEASNLDADDDNEVIDVFLHDRNTGSTTLISKSSAGVQGNGGSTDPTISADGRYIAFTSEANNLVAGDTNGVLDVFVHDRVTGDTERVSVADASGDEGDLASLEPSISADGRYVAFKSAATNLVPPTVTTEQQIFVHDRDTGATLLASRHAEGSPGNDTSELPSISGNGRYVAFESEATNLVDSVPDLFPNYVYVHDLVAGTTEIASLRADGMPANSSVDPVISFDGRYVAFSSIQHEIVPGDTNSTFDVFVRDRIAGTNERVSVSSAGVEGNNQSTTPSISADGLHVAFHGLATNLTPEPDNNGAVGLDVFIHDRMQVGPEPAVNVGDDAQIYLGETFTRSGEFDDPDSSSWTATVDYGAGDGPQPLALNPDNTFDLSHTYQDIGFHTITVEVCDADENCGTDSLQVLVIESPLIVLAGPNQNVAVGETVNLAPATFTDPDNLNSHTATIDWGDGSPIEAGTVDQALNEVHGSHIYSDAGVYGAVVCVQDNVSLEDCDGFIVDVSEVTNEPPGVDFGGGVVNEGSMYSESGTFSDPDSASWTATVDYGDGNGVEPLALAGMTFQLSHTYADNGIYTAQVCVTDDGSAEGCGSASVTVNNVAPNVNAGGDQSVQVGEVIDLDPATFTDPGTADTHTATIEWGDGSALESGAVDQQADTVSGSHSYAATGQFTVTVCVSDDDGGQGCDTFLVDVSGQQDNEPPSVDVGDAPAPGNEGSPLVRGGSFSDPDSATWTATVDYGDGTGTASLALAGLDFTLNHTYADDGLYTVVVCVTDDGNEQGCDSLPVTISNVAPVVEAGPDRNITTGVLLSLAPASFIDPGTADTHTSMIDWGDGSPPEAGTVNQSANTVSGSHIYSAAGNYIVSVCVADDDEQGCDSFEVSVQPVQQSEARLCANRYTGDIRMPLTDCSPGELTLNLPDDLPLTLCANPYTGQLRYPGARPCVPAERSLALPAAGPVDVCVNRYTSGVRYVPAASRCTGSERHVVLGRIT